MNFLSGPRLTTCTPTSQVCLAGQAPLNAGLATGTPPATGSESPGQAGPALSAVLERGGGAGRASLRSLTAPRGNAQSRETVIQKTGRDVRGGEQGGQCRRMEVSGWAGAVSQERTGSSKFYFSIFSAPSSYTVFSLFLQQCELRVDTPGRQLSRPAFFLTTKSPSDSSPFHVQSVKNLSHTIQF